ncbi:hypothetical protein PHYPSEUDO_011706 [Phytophthora pseudosyringae]|uniref:Uncharacterized protein n=1 Tax=Phytophthora pseudosyringae TaxID=221518 RepID=A0A8T1W4N4_9STRA|nr:hypothetical protein PHYPSEUDO_011706 [Phytophthora pseudosyringae]
MKRGTPEERRWKNGLRQGARTSGASASMPSPMVRRTSGPRRPRAETKKSSGNPATTTPLVATAALQTYLRSDIDAQSRIPRPGAESGGKWVSVSPDETRLSSATNVQRSEVKRLESGKPTQLRVPVDTKIEASASRAESPLSRFQKHVRMSRSRSFLRGSNFS